MYQFFESLIDPLRPQPATQPPTGTAAFFWFYLQPIKGVLLVTLALSGVSALCELYVYIYLGRILDWMSVADRTTFLSTHGSSLIWMTVVVVVIRPVSLLATRALINLALAPGLANATRWHNHRYVLRQSMSFFQNDFAGRIAQKVMQTGHAVRESVLNIVDGAWMLLIYLLGTVVFFAEINSLLLWPVALWCLAYLVVIVFMVPPVRRKSAHLSEQNSALIGRVVDSYTNIQSVKLFAHHSIEEDFAGEGLRRQTQAFRVLMRAILQMTISITVLNTLLIAGTAAASIALWLNEAVSVGEIAIANALVIRLNQMSGWVLRSITSLFEHVGTVQNGIETISQPLTIADHPNAKSLQVGKGHVVFDAVGFGYDEELGSLVDGADNELSESSKGETVTGEVGQDVSTSREAASNNTGNTAEGLKGVTKPSVVPVVHDCSFEILPGEKVGLVGKSGAGKSTLINLLMRFHDLDQGRITIDGQDVRSVTQESLRASIAVVTQDTSLLHRSIRENIRYGQAQASDEQIIRASEQAEAMSFIPDLIDPQGRQGLEAFVGERGVKLSGGQRQRIAIARVILKNAPILILDEATSALDSEVEAAIQQQLTRLMEGKTVLAVAHRLSTIAALDKLIVLDGGRIIEAGNHEQLIAQKGLYARLWARQSGGFLGAS